ncbi:unnamed protein product, partial [Prorocentrum cordatum]
RSRPRRGHPDPVRRPGRYRGGGGLQPGPLQGRRVFCGVGAVPQVPGTSAAGGLVRAARAAGAVRRRAGARRVRLRPQE